QAEDGIRDFHVTGVQTCALPISVGTKRIAEGKRFQPQVRRIFQPAGMRQVEGGVVAQVAYPGIPRLVARLLPPVVESLLGNIWQIGRASCRERAEMSMIAVWRDI